MNPMLRTVITGAVVGVLGVGSALAGVVAAGDGVTGAGSTALVDEVTGTRDTAPAVGQGTAPVAVAPSLGGDAFVVTQDVTEAAAALQTGRLDAGWFRAGGAVGSLIPNEDIWVQGSDCTGAPEQLYTPLTPEGCLITFDMRWADGFDETNPLQVRSMALSNGQDVLVMSSLDTVGYMSAYPEGTCDRCGLTEIAEDLSAELGIPVENFSWSSSHTHGAPSTIADGPAWYYNQLRDQIRATALEAVTVAAGNPAVQLESGSVRARALNTDRRIVDRAVPDDEITWLRAFVPDAADPDSPGATVATMGNFAVHLTVRTANAELHSGAVGPYNRRLEEVLGGTSLWTPGALGDQKIDRGWGVNGLGISMADLMLGEIMDRDVHVLQSNDIEVARTTVQLPIENQFFVAALGIGYAIRSIDAPYGGGPLTVAPQKGGANISSCQSAGEVHVVGNVTAMRIGARGPAGKIEVGDQDSRPVETDNVTIIQAPGELFASIGLIVKDYMSRSNTVMVQAMTNDTLGYMVPSNQFDYTAGQGNGIVNNMTGLGNYEEALSLGPCTGDIVMNAMIEMGAQVGSIGEGEGR
jgi:hypothetical protein